MIEFNSESPYFAVIQENAGNICLKHSELGIETVLIFIQNVLVGVACTYSQALSSVYITFSIK